MADPRLDHCPRPPVRRRGANNGGDQAVGRSRGGFGTKVHASVSPLGHPVELRLTGGPAADLKQAEALLAGHRPAAVIADAGSDRDALVAAIPARGAEPVIEPSRSRKTTRLVDWTLYRERNVAERFWSQVTQYRRVATRYEKKAANFLGFVQLASIMVMLK